MRTSGDATRRGGLLPEGDGAQIVLYDFRRPTKLARDHIRVLQMSFETFARRLGTLLTSSLRALCQINLLAIEQQTYEEYISGLSTPTLLAPFTTKPLPGTSVLELSTSSALSCIDHMLGGPGGAQPTRPLTDIEGTLMRGLVEQILGVLTYALEPIAPVETALGAIEFNPPFLQAAGTTDMMIVVSFETRIGADVGVATLCLPFASVFPRLQARRAQRPLSALEQANAAHNAVRVRDGLGEVPVEISVQFQPVPLTPARIAELAPGDLIALPHRVSAPLAVRCGGTTYTHVLAGREGSRLVGLVVDKKLGERS
jgi:flagellar motor switch protein FliM